jgi:hypothetical protein
MSRAQALVLGDDLCCESNRWRSRYCLHFPTRTATGAFGKPLVVAYFEGVGHMVSLIIETQAEARQRGIAFLPEHF